MLQPLRLSIEAIVTRCFPLPQPKKATDPARVLHCFTKQNQGSANILLADSVTFFKYGKRMIEMGVGKLILFRGPIVVQPTKKLSTHLASRHSGKVT